MFIFVITLITNCKSIQIIFGRNTAKKIWNWLIVAILTFIRYASLVCMIKWRQFYLNSIT